MVIDWILSVYMYHTLCEWVSLAQSGNRVSTSLGNSAVYLTVFARNRDTAVPAEGNGDLKTLICVLVARPRRCLTLSNPVLWQNWMAAYNIGYTLRMKTLFSGWPVMAHETHTRRRRLCTSTCRKPCTSRCYFLYPKCAKIHLQQSRISKFSGGGGGPLDPLFFWGGTGREGKERKGPFRGCSTRACRPFPALYATYRCSK